MRSFIECRNDMFPHMQAIKSNNGFQGIQVNGSTIHTLGDCNLENDVGRFQTMTQYTDETLSVSFDPLKS